MIGKEIGTPAFLHTIRILSQITFFYISKILHVQCMKGVTISRVIITWEYFCCDKGALRGVYRDKSQKRLMHATAVPYPSSGSSKPGGFFHWNGKGFSYQKAVDISKSPSLSRCRISSNLNATSVVIKPTLQRNKTKENILEGALDSIKGLNFSLYYTFSIWLKHGAEYTRILLVV